MFTGLVETIGEVIECKPTGGGGTRFRVRSTLASELVSGDSLAVNGVCLTVILAEGGEIQADVGPETLRITTLGELDRGTLVNLERPLRADGRFGGHFVQGHVDAVGRVEELRRGSDGFWLTVGFPSSLEPYIVHKGSIAIDGISLTVAGLGRDRFDVMVIPYTLDHTSLKALRVRDRVNLECDMVGKYVVRAAELAGLTLTSAKNVH
jgi:riboflavin synthase